jgi:hypothetical protein
VERFIAAFDLHLGYERRGGHKVPLHDPKAWGALLAFASDFQPDTFILGGDVLDCGPVSHHNKGKPGRVEGLRILGDAEECRQEVIAPIEGIVGKGRLTYVIGNHEKWLTDAMEDDPALEGILSVERLLGLGANWEVPLFGNVVKAGKLHFIHGHEVKGGENVAKNAVIAYERSIRFGHHHTYQTYTKNSALDQRHPKTGIAVPCLCGRGPRYGEGAPNRWVQGFNFGEIDARGNFTDFIAIIVDGTFRYDGKTYRG